MPPYFPSAVCLVEFSVFRVTCSPRTPHLEPRAGRFEKSSYLLYYTLLIFLL